MRKKSLTNMEAVGIGLIVFIIVVVLIFIALYSTPLLLAVPLFIMVTPLPIIMGALLGKFLTKNRVGTLLGAVFGLVLGFWLFLLIASNSSFD